MTLRRRIILLLLLFPGLWPCRSFGQNSDSGSVSRQEKYDIFPAISGDTGVTNVSDVLRLGKSRAEEYWLKLLKEIRTTGPGISIKPKDSLSPGIAKPLAKLFSAKSALRLTAGYAAYDFQYRSNVDTPYVERNLTQHNVTGQFNLVVAGLIPLQVNYWSRHSNSNLFRDITDVQVNFNAAAFRQQLQASLKDRLLAITSGISDTLTEKLYTWKKQRLNGLTDILKTSFSEQRIAEAYEILRVPKITWVPNLPDSVNGRREDSIKKVMTLLLDLYHKTLLARDSLQKEVDSMSLVYKTNKNKVRQIQQLLKSGIKDHVSFKKLEKLLEENGLDKEAIPRKYRWLMGIRRFSLGRSTANYSDLTASNISVKGINLEYNSWYYFALLAGVVNYRFRDFAVKGLHNPQSLVLVRAGIGRPEQSHFILSGYRGQKHLYGTGSYQSSPVPVSGISAEAKWLINRHTWISAEVAQSITPDLRAAPPKENSGFSLKDRSSQGVALRLYSWLPGTNTRVEAFYKHTGANFQSFNSYQTNADLESWYVKAEQNLFKRKLRISAAIRKNEFSNPFVVQNYKSNTVFKSVTASLRMRKWPLISVGYQPMSQLTYLDNRVIENRFQTLNATLYHSYKMSNVRMASTAMFNKFFNTGSDSGFVYYNAFNFYWTQQLFFRLFSAHIGASHTQNSTYTLNVLEGGIQPKLNKVGSVGAGIRINSFNRDVIKVGGYLNANIRILKNNILSVSYEHGYLPGFAQTLVENQMATVQFIKRV